MQTDEREHLKQHVKTIIREHTDFSHPMKMEHLYRHVTGQPIIPMRRHEQTRIIRSLVQQLRQEGCPIGSHASGYFWAANESELEPTVAKLHKQAMTNLRTEASLKRIGFNELLKQYEIEFKQENTINE